MSLFASHPHSYPSHLDPNKQTSIAYRETVDGTRILLVATELIVRLVRYIIPVPVLGLGRGHSPPVLGVVMGDCERAVTGLDRAELGLVGGPGIGTNSVCVPPGETTGPGAQLAAVFKERARSLSWSCTFRL